MVWAARVSVALAALSMVLAAIDSDWPKATFYLLLTCATTWVFADELGVE